METLRIFGGKPSLDEQAVDVEAVPTSELGATDASATERAKRMAFWGFLGALAVVVGASAFYVTSRAVAHADANPIPPPPRALGPKPPGTDSTGLIVPVTAAKALAPVIDPPVIGEAKATSVETKQPIGEAKSEQPKADGKTVIATASNEKPLERPVIVEPPPEPPMVVKTADKPIAPLEWSVKKGPADLGKPELGKWYLQLGSLDKGVAEVIVEGMISRGFNAVWGPGVSDKLGRVLVGPFDSLEQAEGVRKQVEDLGFRPFAKRIGPEDVRAGSEPATASPQAGNAKPPTPSGKVYAALPEK